MIKQQQELIQEISDAINEIVGGVEYDDEFYKYILDKMVVNDKDNIDVYLNLLPLKWSYTVARSINCPHEGRLKKALAPERNISGASVGSEELNHLEMVGTIVYQLTRNLSEEEIKKSGFDTYFVDHTTGVYPADANGMPWSAATIQVTGDTITDLHEDMAAEQKARTTYDNILRFCDDPDVKDPIRFLREREIVHYQRFGEAKRGTERSFKFSWSAFRYIKASNPTVFRGITGFRE